MTPEEQIPEGATPFTLDLEMDTRTGEVQPAPTPSTRHEFTEAPKNLTGHDWTQRGNELVCTSCPYAHGFLIDTHLVLVANDQTKGPTFQNVLTGEVDSPAEHKHYISK